MNVAEERYCPRVDSWLATWPQREYHADGKCAECGTGVVCNPTVGEGAVRSGWCASSVWWARIQHYHPLRWKSAPLSTQSTAPVAPATTPGECEP
jgi:hypothetical protein